MDRKEYKERFDWIAEAEVKGAFITREPIGSHSMSESHYRLGDKIEITKGFGCHKYSVVLHNDIASIPTNKIDESTIKVIKNET